MWVVGRSGDLFAIDTADGLRSGGPRFALAKDARAVTVDAMTGTLHQYAGREWRPVGIGAPSAPMASVAAADVSQSIGVVRFPGRDRRAEASAAMAAPIVVLDPGAIRRWHWLPPTSLTLSAGAPSGWATSAATHVVMELDVRCGAAPCAGAEALIGATRAEIHFADLALEGAVQKREDRWIVRAETNGPLAAGTYPLVATLVDPFGNRSRFDDYEVVVDVGSTVHARRVAPKATPVVGISSPANNAIFVAPASVTINAAASVTGATLTKVEFLRNGTLLATDTTAPYSYAWTNVAAGTYALTAKAYDNAGGTTTSTAVNITVKTNVAPSVSLTAPTNNAVFTAPATIGLAANASDTDGTIAKVEFFNGTTRLATDTVAPYAHSWTNVAGGTYTLTAKATDDKGAVTTSPAITAIVNRPPSTSITAPANNAVLVAPVNLTVTASASDADGTVSKVEFFRNGTLAATDTTSPYSNAWSNVPLGTHTLTSRATDNRGANHDVLARHVHRECQRRTERGDHLSRPRCAVRVSRIGADRRDRDG